MMVGVPYYRQVSLSRKTRNFIEEIKKLIETGWMKSG